jgi:hypothetical protein
MSNRLLIIWVSGVLTAALLSCGGTAGVKGSASRMIILDSVDSLKEGRAFNDVGAVKAEVKARVLKRGKRIGSFKGALTMRPPDSFRIRLFGLMGDAVADIVRTGDYVEVFVPRYNTIFRGWAPSISDPPDAQYSIEQAGPGPVLVVSPLKPKADRPTVKHYFESATGLHTGSAAFVSGKRALDVGYSRYEGVVPIQIKLVFADGMEVELTLKGPRVVSEAEDRFFVSFDSRGRKVMPLEALTLQGKKK